MKPRKRKRKSAKKPSGQKRKPPSDTASKFGELRIPRGVRIVDSGLVLEVEYEDETQFDAGVDRRS